GFRSTRGKVTTPLNGASEGISSAGGRRGFRRPPGRWLRVMRRHSEMGSEPIRKDLGFLVLANALGAVFPDEGEQLRLMLASAVTLLRKGTVQLVYPPH